MKSLLVLFSQSAEGAKASTGCDVVGFSFNQLLRTSAVNFYWLVFLIIFLLVGFSLIFFLF